MFKKNFVAVIKCNGKVLREYPNNTVRLPFGSEYSVYLKNEDTRRALVEISVDGDNVLKGNKLIINGNSSSEIKGFMRDMQETNNFKFIEKTEEISNHRGDKIEDGLVKISFCFEKKEEIPEIYFPNLSYRYQVDNNGFKDFDNSSIRYGSNTYSTRTTNVNESNWVCCSTNVFDNITPTDGITVKGSKVNQAYNYGYIGPVEEHKHTIIFCLKGDTRVKKYKIAKPITVKTIIKCETCGRKNKTRNNFCYNCGTYLD